MTKVPWVIGRWFIGFPHEVCVWGGGGGRTGGGLQHPPTLQLEGHTIKARLICGWCLEFHAVSCVL